MTTALRSLSYVDGSPGLTDRQVPSWAFRPGERCGSGSWGPGGSGPAQDTAVVGVGHVQYLSPLGSALAGEQWERDPLGGVLSEIDAIESSTSRRRRTYPR